MGSNEQHWQIAKRKVEAYGATPEDVWNKALAYFEWCTNNPIDKGEVLKTGRLQGATGNVKVPRPYNEAALCIHVGITREYLYEGLRSKDETYKAVCQKILYIIEAQILEYSMVGVFNPLVGIKKLGLDNVNEQPVVAPSIVINIDRKGNPPQMLIAEPAELIRVEQAEVELQEREEEFDGDADLDELTEN